VLASDDAGGSGLRVTSNFHGSANFASSRLAEHYHSVALSPAAIFVPLSSKPRVSVTTSATAASD
jgi:hypothetical protein